MNCDEVRKLLDDFVDGDLPSGESHAVEGHLRACAACCEEQRQLRSLMDAAADLPGSIEPPRDLWRGIARRIEEPAESRIRVPRPGWWSWRIAAAAASVMIVVGLGAWMALGPRTGPAPVAPAPAPEPSAGAVVPAAGVPAGLDAAEITFHEARQQLRAALAERRSALSPQTLRTVDANMKIIENAVIEIHAALERDPGNRELQRNLVAARQREVAFLLQVTQTAALRTR